MRTPPRGGRAPNAAPLMTLALTLSVLSMTSLIGHVTPARMTKSMDNGPEQAYADKCGRTCTRNGTLTVRTVCMAPMRSNCYPCDCDKDCHLYGTCCPLEANNTYVFQHDDQSLREDGSFSGIIGSDFVQSLGNDSGIRSIPDRFYCSRPPLTIKVDEWYLMVNRCPDTWDDNTTRHLCEVPSLKTPTSVTSYSDPDSGISFINIHCARCNYFDAGRKELKPWAYKVECSHFQDLYWFTDRFDFISTVNRGGLCFIKFILPNTSVAPKRCYVTSRLAIDQTACPEGYDPELKRLCDGLGLHLGFRVKRFKNVYCALCVRYGTYCFRPKWKPVTIDSKFPPIALLFGQTRSVQEKIALPKRCNDTQWENDQGECQSPNCTQGKLLETSNGTCGTAIPQIQGLGYSVAAIFSVTRRFRYPPLNNIRVELDDVNTWLIDSLRPLVAEMDMRLDYLCEYPTRGSADYPIGEQGASGAESANGTEEGWEGSGSDEEEDYDEGTDEIILREIQISGHLLAPATMPRSEFEEILLQFLAQEALDDNATAMPHNLTLIPTHVGYYVTGFQGIDTQFYQRENNEHCYAGYEQISDWMSPLEQSPKGLFRYHHVSQCQNIVLWDVVALFIDVMPSLTCPFISFNVTRQPVFENGTVVFTFELRGKEVNMTSQDNVSYSPADGQVQVCLDFLNNLTGRVSYRYVYRLFGEGDPMSIVEYYVEVTCLCISIAFLVASVFTYCLLPSLRTLPGLNNLSLCLSLLTAQASLLVTSLFGLRGYFPMVYCLIHAIIFHYSWLASFAWMSVCCVHMYRVFTGTGNIMSNPRSYQKRYRRYCLVAFGIPALIVAMTTVITMTATGGSSSGYNYELCFFDTATSVWIIVGGLLAPFALSTVTNIVLFALTVREIVSVSRLAQSTGTRKSHGGVVAYVKLSSLTGAFCVLAAIAVQFRSPIAALCASPFAALQGLFIFLSFQANTHVLSLYKALLFPHDKKPSGTFDSIQTTSAM